MELRPSKLLCSFCRGESSPTKTFLSETHRYVVYLHQHLWAQGCAHCWLIAILGNFFATTAFFSLLSCFGLTKKRNKGLLSSVENFIRESAASMAHFLDEFHAFPKVGYWFIRWRFPWMAFKYLPSSDVICYRKKAGRKEPQIHCFTLFVVAFFLMGTFSMEFCQKRLAIYECRWCYGIKFHVTILNCSKNFDCDAVYMIQNGGPIRKFFLRYENRRNEKWWTFSESPSSFAWFLKRGE